MSGPGSRSQRREGSEIEASVNRVKSRKAPLLQRYADERRTADYWLVARCADGATSALVVELPGGGERLLPVFSAAVEAEVFVWLSELEKMPGEGWFARRTGSAELLSILIGPRRSVRRVALDPHPELMDAKGAEQGIEPACVTRQAFVERLLSERYGSGTGENQRNSRSHGQHRERTPGTHTAAAERSTVLDTARTRPPSMKEQTV